MVLVDDSTSIEAVEIGIGKVHDDMMLNREYSVKVLKDVTLFLYNELKHGVSLKSLIAKFKLISKNNDDNMKTLRVMLMNVVSYTHGVNLKLETRSFVYEPAFGKIRLKRTNEEVVSYLLTSSFIKDGLITEATLCSIFTLEVLEYNDKLLSERFSQSVWSEIKGMFNFGVEGDINKRLSIIESHLSSPNPLCALTTKSVLSFLPMGIIECLITSKGELPSNYKHLLSEYASINLINGCTISEFDDAIIDTGKEPATSLSVQEA